MNLLDLRVSARAWMYVCVFIDFLNRCVYLLLYSFFFAGVPDMFSSYFFRARQLSMICSTTDLIMDFKTPVTDYDTENTTRYRCYFYIYELLTIVWGFLTQV